MKKKKGILLIVFLIVIGFAIYLLNTKNKNVFDEMYYGEERIFHIPYGSSVFLKIPDIEERVRKDDVYEDIITERYNTNIVIDKVAWNVSFSFEFYKKVFSISFGRNLQDKKRLFVDYNYSKDKGLLSEDIYVSDKTGEYERNFYHDADTIKKFLDEANVSVESVKRAADELLYNKVISDWTTYTHSEFSKDNIGRVKIERNGLFQE